MNKIKYIIIIVFAFCFIHSLKADHAYYVHIKLNDKNFNKEVLEFQDKSIIPDTSYLPAMIRTFLKKCHTNSYLSAGVDSIIKQDSSIYIYITTGKSYQWVKINSGNIDNLWLRGTGILENSYHQKKINTYNLSELMDQILYQASVNGYPFAEVMLINTKITENEVESELYIEKNARVTYDSILIVGKVNIQPEFLINYLKIIPGKPYNEEVINGITQKLSNLPYIKVNRSPVVEFSGGMKARVILYLEDINASYFNGIAGFAPNHSMNNQLVLTGEAILNLINPFGRGMFMNFEWRKQRINTQEIGLSLNAPYIFSTQFGIASSFKMLRFDTLYNQVFSQLKLSYLFSSQKNFYIFGEISQTGSTNTQEVPVESKVLSNQISFYGLGIELNTLDYKYNPRSGYHLDINIAAGNKIISENIQNTEKTDTGKTSTIYRIGYKLGNYFSIASQSLIYTNIYGGYLTDPRPELSQLYVLGGFSGLKGFDEGTIHANIYTILNIEYRYLTGAHSHFKFFVNGGWYSVTLNEGIEISDFPYGIGTGYNFNVPNGIFSINYAIGSEHGNPPDILNGKIHFGFKTLF